MLRFVIRIGVLVEHVLFANPFSLLQDML